MPSTGPRWRSLPAFFQKEIWHPAHIGNRTFRGRSYAALRVISITFIGLRDTRATSRAAALSFSTLLGLGPLIGLAVLIAGFAIGKNNPDLVVTKLNDLIQFVAPQVSHFEENDKFNAPSIEAAHASNESNRNKPALAVNPKLVDLINNFIAGTRSGAAGAISAVSLIVIVLLLFTSIEQVFNDIWGVRRGRSWLLRIVFYWTILSLGAVLFFGAVGALSAATFIGYFKDHLPFGKELAGAFTLALPAFSALLIVLILTLFYRYIPNTHVNWSAAILGAVVVTALLVLNNLLAFFYFSRVDLTRSLYGSLGILPILMFGLYVFWLFILVGGQISYAVQNVHFRISQAAWSNLSEATREALTLAVLLIIGRRFQSCLPPCTVSELTSGIKAPTQILNECLNRLVDMRLISQIPPNPGSGSSDYLYQPSRPLDHITFAEFKQAFESIGDDPTGETVNLVDPLVARYREVLDRVHQDGLFTRSLDKLFAEYPLSGTPRSP